MSRRSWEAVPGVRNARTSDLPAIAAIHAAAFPESMFTRLGPEVVTRYYHWLLTGMHEAVFLVHDRGANLAGFVVGGRFRDAVEGFLTRNRLLLARRLLRHPWLLLDVVGRRRVMGSLRAIVRPAQPPQSVAPLYRCLAIAVAPTDVRRGVGRALMSALTAAAEVAGAERMQLGVDPRNAGAVRFYEHLGWTRMLQHNAWFGDDVGVAGWWGLMERRL